MAVVAKTLLSSATAPGPGTAVDTLPAAPSTGFRSFTMQVIPGGATPDPFVRVKLEGSLDNVNWFSLGEQTGAGSFNNDQDVVQYVRGNVTAIASGNVSALVAYTGG